MLRLSRFEKTNEMLSNCCTLSAGRLNAARKDLTLYNIMIMDMKKDLDSIFRRLRLLFAYANFSNLLNFLNINIVLELINKILHKLILKHSQVSTLLKVVKYSIPNAIINAYCLFRKRRTIEPTIARRRK